jgi:hypothetical protein
MKVSPKVDFPIQVIPETDERDRPDLQQFEGIYQAVLNYTVTVVFVPDVSELAPPWDDSRLPSGVELAENPRQAGVISALLADYVVTPNDALAGTEERIAWAPPGLETGALVFYVTGAEFAQFATELAELSEIVYSRYPKETASTLRRYSVVRFLEQRVADSGQLRPYHAAMLGRPPAQG